jgi:hypothetical protein
MKGDENGGAWGTYGGKDKCVQDFDEEIQGKGTTVNTLTRSKWYNIKINLTETGWWGLIWLIDSENWRIF